MCDVGIIVNALTWRIHIYALLGVWDTIVTQLLAYLCLHSEFTLAKNMNMIKIDLWQQISFQ